MRLLARIVLIVDWVALIGILAAVLGLFTDLPAATTILWSCLAGFLILTALYGYLYEQNAKSGNGPGQVGPPPRLT